MTTAAHPPYGVPELGNIAPAAQFGRDFHGLYNLRLEDPTTGSHIRPILTATFYEGLYGPAGGIEISIRRSEPYGVKCVRVGDKEVGFILNDEFDVDALGLWDLGDSLIDFIPQAIEHLADLYDEIVDTIRGALAQGMDYAVQRLNSTAQQRSKKNTKEGDRHKRPPV